MTEDSELLAKFRRLSSRQLKQVENYLDYVLDGLPAKDRRALRDKEFWAKLERLNRTPARPVGPTRDGQ